MSKASSTWTLKKKKYEKLCKLNRPILFSQKQLENNQKKLTWSKIIL